ncbi:MAG: signal peptide peptidase SppA [Bacteroidia bacterium]|nr:signal peptide peptidase SppA [Bacteroidia bacterium]
MNFIKNIFASFLGVILAFLIGIPFLFLIIGGIAAAIGGSSEKVEVKTNTVLKMDLTGEIVENAAEDPLEFNFDQFMPFAGATTTKTGLFQVISSIQKAKEDDKIRGIYLTLPAEIQANWASLKSIRDALVDFKTSGKFIYAYSEVYAENSYYLASTADKLYMPATGMIEFNGFVAQPMFYTGLFEKIDLKPEIFRVGTFKSAVEPYFLKQMSDSNRVQTQKYMDDLWQVFAEDVAISRSVSVEKINAVASDFIFGDGEQALKAGLIDAVLYEQQVLDALKTELSLEDDDTINFLSLKKYERVPAKSDFSSNKIAIVFAEGGIQSGKSGDGTMGSETIVEALRKVRKDKNVKAVVFRINSRGGSALASDMIAEEIRLLSEEKPVIASMGDFAASGGYYIAAPCDKIYAQANTITGSIGIFGILFNTQELFNKNLGITFDEVETHTHSNFGNPNFPMPEMERQFIQKTVEKGYGNFLKVVLKGRGFADSLAVDKIAQGRVWSGMEAKKIKLVDEIGDLNKAIAAAAEMAEIGTDYRLERLPKIKSPFEEILGGMMETSSNYVDQQNPLYEEMETLRKIKKDIPQSGVYTLMPFQMEIR